MTPDQIGTRAPIGGSVAVGRYDDRLEIISIGDLHFGLTPEALFREHESKPWNPMIARTFYRRGIIETWGRGTLKIARLMQEAGLEPPTVSKSELTIHRTLRTLRESGRLVRIGPDKGGRWQVLE